MKVDIRNNNSKFLEAVSKKIGFTTSAVYY